MLKDDLVELDDLTLRLKMKKDHLFSHDLYRRSSIIAFRSSNSKFTSSNSKRIV